MAAFDARYRHNVALAELAKVTGTFNVTNSPFYPTRADGSTPAPASPSIGTGAAPLRSTAAPHP